MKICPSCSAKFPDEELICEQCNANLMVDTASTFIKPTHALIGKVIARNYRIEKLLGTGGMGAVFQAHQISLDRKVALKVLLAPLAMDREILERFQREARAASNIGHPGIIQIIDMGFLEESAPFIAMELLEGEDLRVKLHREGRLETGLAIKLILQACDALQAAHDKGIVHRDLKPDNLFLVYRKGKVPLVKLLDFGLTKIKGADKKITNTGALIGTPNYMAPEQVTGEFEVTHSVDIYAAGAILYETLTGKMVYEGPNVQSILAQIMTADPLPPRSHRPELNEAIEAVILKAMARNPDQRYVSMAMMIDDLSRLGKSHIPESEMATIAMPSARVEPSGEPPPALTTTAAASAPAPPTAPAPVRSKTAAPLIIGGVVVAGLLFAIAFVIGALYLASIFGKTTSRSYSSQSFDSTGAVSTDGGGGKLLGNGNHPYLCCGKSSCALVFQQHQGGHERIIFQKLEKDLSFAGKPLALTRKNKTYRWPACFARKDGGYLVFFQQSLLEDESSYRSSYNRIVISSEGKPGKIIKSIVKDGQASMAHNYSPYSVARGGNRIFLAWHYASGDKEEIRASIFDMDGRTVDSSVKISESISISAPAITCLSKKCLVAWTKVRGDTGWRDMIAVISTTGKIIKREKTVLKNVPLKMRKILIPLPDGVIMGWAEQKAEYSSGLMMAKLTWEGSFLKKPKPIKGFNEISSTSMQNNFLAVDPKDGSVTVAHILKPEDTNIPYAAAMTIKKGGKVPEPSAVTSQNVYSFDVVVFNGPKGKPVVMYLTGYSSINFEIRAVPFKQ